MYFFFFAFLSWVVGAVSVLFSPFYVLLLLPLSAYLFFFRKEKKLLLSLLFVLFPVLLLLFLPKGNPDITSLQGLVIERRSSYYLLLSSSGTYLVYDKDREAALFSIVRLEGKATAILSRHFESGFRFDSYLKTKGVFLEFGVEEKKYVFRAFDLSGFLSGWAFSHLDKTSRPLAEALLFGERLTGEDSYKDLSSLGLTSLLSLSGFNLHFFLSLLEKILGKRGKKAYPYLELGILSFFLLLSGFRYTLKRLFLLAFFRRLNAKKKQFSSLDILSLSGLVLLLLEPYSVLNPSFYTPFPFLFFLRIFAARGKKNPLSFYFLLLLFFFPYTLSRDASYPLLYPLFQLILVPYAHLLFLLSLPLLLCPVLGPVINLLSKGLIGMSSAFSMISVVLVSGDPPFYFYLIYYFLLLSGMVFQSYSFPRQRRFAFLFLALVSGFSFVPDYLPQEEVSFVDVDQGDCTLVRDGKTNLLIDTGGLKWADLGTESLIPFFRKKKIDHLDAVLLTHHDFDHYGALASLKLHFPVTEVVEAEDFLKEDNDTITFGGLDVKNLNHYEIDKDTNSLSGVYKFTIRNTKVLVMGDAPIEVEEKMLSEHQDVDVDILKLGHHGSKTSSSRDFLIAASPSVAILSCGTNNTYGFPHARVLQDLKSLSIPCRRTDQEGTIVYRC